MKNLLVFLFVLCITALQAQVQTATVNTSGGTLNVRARANGNSDLIVKLKKGAKVVVLERGEEWTAIRPPENSSLYVFASLIENGKIKTDAKLRSGTGDNFQYLCILPAGTNVKVIATENSWHRIAVPAYPVKCYVATRFLKFDAPPAPRRTAVKQTVRKERVDVQSFSADEIERLRKVYFVKGSGKQVRYVGRIKTGKTSVDFKDKTYFFKTKGSIYHIAGMIPGNIDLDKNVEITGVAWSVSTWKYPLIEVESIVQK